jgi:hypothetical protein
VATKALQERRVPVVGFGVLGIEFDCDAEFLFGVWGFTFRRLIFPHLPANITEPCRGPGSADAETVNNRLEARIGADCVILRIDVDE